MNALKTRSSGHPRFRDPFDRGRRLADADAIEIEHEGHRRQEGEHPVTNPWSVARPAQHEIAGMQDELIRSGPESVSLMAVEVSEPGMP